MSDQDEIIRARFAAGMPDHRIGEEIGLTRHQVRTIRYALGVLRAKNEGVQRAGLWTDAEVDHVRRRVAERVSQRDIAAEMDRSWASVHNIITLHQIKAPPRICVPAEQKAANKKARDQRANAARQRLRASKIKPARPAANKPAPKPALPGIDDIQRFIRERGVTQLPIAACAHTTATIPEEARVALRAYRDSREGCDTLRDVISAQYRARGTTASARATRA